MKKPRKTKKRSAKKRKHRKPQVLDVNQIAFNLVKSTIREGEK
jgi:hypothetical protein